MTVVVFLNLSIKKKLTTGLNEFVCAMLQVKMSNKISSSNRSPNQTFVSVDPLSSTQSLYILLNCSNLYNEFIATGY